MLERLLDKLLSGEERQRAKEAVRADPEAIKQVKLQQQINEGLARAFAPIAPTTVAVPRRPRVWVWSLSAAAALLLALFGAWAIFVRGASGGRSPLGGVYRAQVASGFVPQKVCTTREEFAKWVQDYYGQPLYPAEPHAGVEFVGWNYAPAVGGNSGVLLAKVKGKEVILVVDRKVREKKPFTQSGDPALHSFRREFGMVVAYEVTPLDEPAILPILSTSSSR